ncbi:MAG: hypothetical protein IJY31_05070 [Muribaculaceae bacterium]|nr:hypothetical protein [Muribaculaceae bacterium]
MKTFRLFGIIMMLVMGMAITSCSDDDDDDNGGSGRYPLTGTWHCNNEGFMYQFNADGSGYHNYIDHLDDPDYADYFTDYKIENNCLCLKWDGDNDYDNKGTIEISGNTFRLNLYNDGEWLTFHKQ